MNIHDYLEKLRAKPVQERQRIAVVVTAVGFAVILVIWLISFREMNKSVETPVDPASANLNDLKNNFQDNLQTGKDSIQNMMQKLPSQTGTMETDSSLQNPVGNLENSQDKNNSVPQLP